MTTGKDYGLPAQYHDWVTVKDRPKQGAFIEVSWGIGDASPTGTGVTWNTLGTNRILVPPRPQLPNVTPGAVVRWKQKNGPVHRSVKLDGPGWHDYCINVMHLNSLYRMQIENQHQTLTDQMMTAEVNDDGFTVELDGL